MFGNDSPFPLVDSFISRFKTTRGYEVDFLKARASRSRSFECHDFTNSIAADVTNRWSIAATSTATTWAVLAEPGGWIRGVTGASVATGALQIYGANKFWNGTRGAGFASLIRLSAVTSVRLEQGFADVVPANGTSAVNLPSSSFNSVTTGAVYVYDHAGSTTTTGLYTVGASTAFQSVATTTDRYDSAATLFVALEIDGTTAKLWLGDASRPAAVVHSAFAASESWVPFVQIKTASGSKTIDIDTLWTWTLARN